MPREKKISLLSVIVPAVTSSLICSVLAVLSTDDYWKQKGWLSEKSASPLHQGIAILCITSTGLMNFTYYLWVHQSLHQQLANIHNKIKNYTNNFSGKYMNEIFIDDAHLSDIGNKLLAEKISIKLNDN